jgi:hypothetical protein
MLWGDAMKTVGLRIVPSLIALNLGIVAVRAAAPATAPASATAGPIRSGDGTDVLRQLEARYGFWFLGGLLPSWAQVDIPPDATAEEAIRLLRAALKMVSIPADARDEEVVRLVREAITRYHVQFPDMRPGEPATAAQARNVAAWLQGLACGLEEVPGAPDHKLWRITPPAEARASPVKYRYGNDPAAIPETNDIITQIIPVSINAVRLQNDLTSMTAVENSTADKLSAARHNCVIVTDTSAKIHRVVEIIGKLDDGYPPPKTIIEYRQLKYAIAADVARAINAHFAPTPATGSRPATAPATGPARPPARLYADSDARTNTVVLNGTQDLVAEALVMIQKLDDEAAPPATATRGAGR